MPIRHLRTLVAVEEHGIVNESAGEVCLRRAAVRQQKPALGSELFLQLFDCNPRTPTLNFIGHSLMEKARVLLRSCDKIVPSILYEKNPAGKISLEAVPGTFTGLIAKAMKILQRSCTGLRIRIIPGLTASLITFVERRQLDALVISRPVMLPEGLRFKPIADERFRLIVSREGEPDDPIHLLATRRFMRLDAVSVADTQKESWIQSNNIDLPEVMELERLDAIACLAHMNLRVSIEPHGCFLPSNSLALKWLRFGKSAQFKKWTPR